MKEDMRKAIENLSSEVTADLLAECILDDSLSTYDVFESVVRLYLDAKSDRHASDIDTVFELFTGMSISEFTEEAIKRNHQNDGFFGKESNFYFKVLDDDNYDVCVCPTKEDDENAWIDTLPNEHYFDIDSCILWALYWLEDRGWREGWYAIKISDPNGNMVKTYHDYDSLLEDAWLTLVDVNIDEDECIEQNWFIFEKGTDRESIWHWFDDRHSKGVGWMMENVEE